MKLDNSDYARSLRSPDAITLRRQLLCEPHIAPLKHFVQDLREKHLDWEFPDFDPLDGGCDADILFLFEKPGRMTSAGGNGSGFISRNNDDSTAEAIFGFMNEADLARKRTVIWNVIPGWNGTRKVTKTELIAGVDSLKNLLPLLTKLRTIVLIGKRAQQAKSLIEPRCLRVLDSAHPSPVVRATRLDVWRAIPSIWTMAR